jgi:hypothetical protein
LSKTVIPVQEQGGEKGKDMKGLLAATAAACAGALLIAGAASAKPPERFTETIPYSGSASCGAFDDLFQGSLELSGMTTFDKAGNPVADVVHVKRVETNWRSDDPSVSMTLTGNWTVHYDYATDTEAVTGQIFKQTYPGLGLLFHDVGRIVNSPGGMVVHGPHDVLEQGNAAFCDALEAIA